MILLFILLFFFQTNTNTIYSEWDSVLQEYVKDGFVDYKTLQYHPENLNLFLDKAEKVQKKKFSKVGQKRKISLLYQFV